MLCIPSGFEKSITRPSFQDISGQVKIDFNNPECVRLLSKCCLQKDFSLDIELPPQKLLPTIPLRLNYLLWIEDLLNHAAITKQVNGVDIGCGASCIYCLLAVRMNTEWKMFALETDSCSIKFAQDNIKRNQMDDRVTVVSQDNDTTIFETLFRECPDQKSFCMCNPPFFSSPDAVTNSANRTGNRKRPRSKNSGTSTELVFENGGELGFVKKILAESLELREKIQIYTTMFGCKKNLNSFIDELRQRKVENFTTTVFVQGKTMRWGIAWSFDRDLKSFKDSTAPAEKASTNVLKHVITGLDFSAATTKLKNLLGDLEISIKVLEEKAGHCHRWEIVATRNTWSNQRRKKRAEKGISTPDDSKDQSTLNEDLHIALEVINNKDSDSTLLQMVFMSGTMSKDCVNQIMQFIKNKFGGKS